MLLKLRLLALLFTSIKIGSPAVENVILADTQLADNSTATISDPFSFNIEISKEFINKNGSNGPIPDPYFDPLNVTVAAGSAAAGKDDEEEEDNGTPSNLAPASHNSVVTITTIKLLPHQPDLCDNMWLGTMYRLSKKSKFFADKNAFFTYDQAKKFCKDNMLVLAELEDMPDHRTIAYYIERVRYNPPGEKPILDQFYIGTNDRREEGVYRKTYRNSNLTFQNFHRSQPDDNNQNEDCVVLGQEYKNAPVGSFDVNCNVKAHAICMFPPRSECYKDCSETVEITQMRKNKGLVEIINYADRNIYYVSNFQAPWQEALSYCIRRKMKLFMMDGIVTRQFLKNLLKWEKDFTQIATPTFEYWTAGKFRETHMSAPIFWHEQETMGHYDHPPGHNQNYTFSGIFIWSTRKKGDPGAYTGVRRDLCLSFGFEGEEDTTPLVRNTNCGMPCYFICRQELPDPEARINKINLKL